MPVTAVIFIICNIVCREQFFKLILLFDMLSYLFMPDELLCSFLVFNRNFYFFLKRLFSVVFFFLFLHEMSFSHWLTLITLVTCDITQNDNCCVSDCKGLYLDFEIQSDQETFQYLSVYQLVCSR